jgi:hypothetical protein
MVAMIVLLCYIGKSLSIATAQSFLLARTAQRTLVVVWPALFSVESGVDAVHHAFPSLAVPHRVEQGLVLSLQVGR